MANEMKFTGSIRHTHARSLTFLLTLFLLTPAVRADEAQERAICEKFSQLVLATAQERDTGVSKEKQLDTARHWDRAAAIDHEPTQADKILSAVGMKAIELAYRHPDMSADALATAVRTKCSVDKDWDVHVGDL